MNRGSFGHRQYFMMAGNGVAFKGDRVYDLPLNGEFEVTQHPKTEEYVFEGLGFECMERLRVDAPPKVVAQVFLPPPVKADMNAFVME
jgi:hypothetical protein